MNPRRSSLLLSVSADVRSSDDVIASEGLRTGIVTGSDFVAKLAGIIEGVCNDMKREDAEAIFDRLLDESGGAMPVPALLGLLAMMG